MEQEIKKLFKRKFPGYFKDDSDWRELTGYGNDVWLVALVLDLQEEGRG